MHNYKYVGMVDDDYITICGDYEDVIGNEAYKSLTANSNIKELL